MASTQEGEFEQSVMWRISIRWKRNGIMFLFEGNTFWGHGATDACEKIHKMRKKKNMSECNLAKFFVFSSSLCKCVSCGILIKKDEYIKAGLPKACSWNCKEIPSTCWGRHLVTLNKTLSHLFTLLTSFVSTFSFVEAYSIAPCSKRIKLQLTNFRKLKHVTTYAQPRRGLNPAKVHGGYYLICWPA